MVCLRSILLSVIVLTLSIANAQAQGARAQCESLERPNIDCACVSKRMDAYRDRAADTLQQRYIAEGYKFHLGLDNSFEDVLRDLNQSDDAQLNLSFQYDGVGGYPENITDYEEGCVIAGAPLAPLPNYTPGPVRETWMAACMKSVGDRRSCQCSLATEERYLSDREFKYHYASYSDYPPGEALSREERYVYLANKYGTTVDDFKQTEAAARARLSTYADKNDAFCSARLWPDQRPGRSAEARAGVPVDFEAPGEITSMDEIMREQEAVAAQTKADAANVDTSAILADAAANKKAFESERAAAQSKGRALNAQAQPRSLLEEGCISGGNEMSYCGCVGDIFDETVEASGASDAVATQLALLMSGGGVSSDDAVAMMQGADPQVLAQAGQLFGANVMKLMSCQ